MVYQDLAGSLAAIEPPVWSGLIATYLTRRGLSVEILDAEAEHLDGRATAKKIATKAARLTVFVVYGQQPSASTQCMPGARQTAEFLSALQFDGKTLVIGTHASALPERTLSEESFDFVCQGEGPLTVDALVHHLNGQASIESVPGLWYRQDGAPKSNRVAEPITDLDRDLPDQAWELLDMSRYRAHNWHCFGDLGSRDRYASLQTSLGCPFKCSFCCINAPFGKAAIRCWSPDNVVARIENLVSRYGIRNIKIPDEMFVLNPKQVVAICDQIIAKGLDLNLWAYARIDTLGDRAMLSKLSRAGFRWLAVGIESASRYVRDGVAKGRFGNHDIVTTVQAVRDQGINIVGNYIFGLPDDTPASMQDTLDLAMTLNTEWANFYCAMAYPGSALYSMAKKKGWALPDDSGGPGWIGYSQHAFDCLPLRTEALGATEVLDFRDRAFDRYFGNPNYLSLVETKFGAETRAHIESMASYRLPRRHHSKV